MDILMGISVALICGAIGLAIGMYRNEDKRGFQFLFEGAYKVAFYHQFGHMDELAVEKRLTEVKESLEKRYWELDCDRISFITGSRHKDNVEYLRGSLLSVKSARHDFDRALGLAYLNGFGKTAERLKGQLKTRKEAEPGNADGQEHLDMVYHTIDSRRKELPKFAQ